MDDKEEQIAEDHWEVSHNRYIGFIDIMGFKDWVARSSPKDVYDVMLKIRKAIDSTYSVFGYRTVESEDGDDEKDTYEDNIRIVNFSDSIIIFTKDGDADCLENLIQTTSVLTDSLFENGVPFKGAIAYGHMTLDFYNSIFFGQPLIDAYQLQEELNFYGIAIHASAEFRHDIEDDESILQYNCPFKAGSGSHLTVVPGISINSDFDDTKFQIVKENVINLRSRTSGALRKYIDNTLKYLDLVESTGKKAQQAEFEE